MAQYKKSFSKLESKRLMDPPPKVRSAATHVPKTFEGDNLVLLRAAVSQLKSYCNVLGGIQLSYYYKNNEAYVYFKPSGSEFAPCGHLPVKRILDETTTGV